MKKVIKIKENGEVIVDPLLSVGVIYLHRKSRDRIDSAILGFPSNYSREVALAICPELETEKIEFADQCLNDVLNKLLMRQITIPKHSNGIAEFVTNYLTSTTNGSKKEIS